MPSFLLNVFKGGFSDYENTGPVGSFKLGTQNIDIRKKRDTLSCQQELTDDAAPGVIVGFVKVIVMSDKQLAFFFTANGKIYSRSMDDGVSDRNYASYHLCWTEPENEICGAIQFYDNAGFTYLVWATETKLHVKKLTGPGYSYSDTWSDVDQASAGSWPKANLTQTSYHQMCQVGGALLICNTTTLAMVGHDFSYTNNALALTPDMTAVKILERGIYAIIGAYKTNGDVQSALFQWDGISDNWLDKKIIPKAFLNTLLDTDKPLAQLDWDGSLFYADFQNVLPITFFPDGGTVVTHAATVDEGLALFGVTACNDHNNNGIYSFGRKKLNAPYVLHLEYALAGAQIGCIKKVRDTLFCSYYNGNTYGIKRVNPDRKAIGTYVSLDLEVPEKLILPNELPTFTKVKITTTPMPAGTSISLARCIDKGPVFLPATMAEEVSSFTTENGVEAEFLLGDQGRIINIQLILTPNGNDTPEILSAEIFFS